MKNELKKIVGQIEEFMASAEGKRIRPNWCFMNSKILSLSIPGLSYEEGMVYIKDLDGPPLHHAWNAYQSHKIDVTAQLAGFKVVSFRCYKRYTHAQLKRKAESRLFHFGNEWQEEMFWFNEKGQYIGDETLRDFTEFTCPGAMAGEY